MTQIIPLSSCRRGEFIFDKKGLIVGSPLSHEYYKIYCLLMDEGPQIIEIYYPFIFFSSPEQLMDIIKIGLLAEEKQLRYLDLNITMPDKQKYVMLYKTPSNSEKAYLMAYLSSLKPKNFIERLSFTWLRNHLSNLPSNAARGNYLFMYYRRGFPIIMRKAYRKKYGSDLPNLVDEIERRYQFVKEYDNFTDFKAKLAEAQRLGKKLEKKIRSNVGFEKFKKVAKMKPFIFPMDEATKTGVLTPEMKKEIDMYRKKI